MRPIVYIASPYTKGSQTLNIHFQARVFKELMDAGRVWPVIPLAMSLVHLIVPRPEQDWIEYDLMLMEQCHAVLRCSTLVKVQGTKTVEYYSQSESAGADAEEKRARELGMPVFYNYHDLYEWALTWTGN